MGHFDSLYFACDYGLKFIDITFTPKAFNRFNISAFEKWNTSQGFCQIIWFKVVLNWMSPFLDKILPNVWPFKESDYQCFSVVKLVLGFKGYWTRWYSPSFNSKGWYKLFACFVMFGYSKQTMLTLLPRNLSWRKSFFSPPSRPHPYSHETPNP